MKTQLTAGLLVAMAVAFPLQAAAAPVFYSGSSGSFAAKVGFDIVGPNLQVTLSNTATGDVLVPTDVLTGVFFNVAGNPALSRVSGTSGGVTYLGTSNVSAAGAAIGGEWAYVNGLSQYGANSGISSSGLGLFGGGDVFPPGTNLSGPASPNGLQYGLASAGDNQATGNAAVLGNELTRFSATFLLGALPTGFALSNIGTVTFQYGTDLSEGHFVGTLDGTPPLAIPEPGALGLVGLGLVALTAGRRRKQ